MLKKIASTLVVGLAVSLMGCPPPANNQGTTPPAGGETTAPAGGDTAAPAGGDTAAPAGGDAKPADTPAAPKGPDLSHVKVGQKFVYALQGGSMEMVWEVTEVDAANFMVKYSTQTHMDMGQGKQPVGDPTPSEWKHVVADTTATAPADTTTPQAKTEKGTHKVGDMEFECLIVESEAGGTKSKTWVPLSKGTDTPTFPGMLKSESNGTVSMELVRIE